MEKYKNNEEAAKAYADLLRLDTNTEKGKLQYESTCLDFAAGANWKDKQLRLPNVTLRALQIKIEKLEAENKLLGFMVENGLGEEDMRNDITYPQEL